MTRPPAPGRAAPHSLPRDGAGDRWADHLRAGGTTPWAAYRHGEGAGPGSGRGTTPAAARPGPPPGAQQLELLRRLNAAGAVPVDLADRVLAAGLTGRGRPDLDLAGDGAERPFGARPVDPALLPAEELLRVAVGLLAEELVAEPSPGRPPAACRGRRAARDAGVGATLRGAGGSRTVVGDPRLVALALERSRLRRPPGPRGTRVLVLGTSVHRMLVDVWVHRCVTDGAPDWSAWLRSWVERGGATPPRIDLPALAAGWADGAGAGRVQVLLGEGAVAPRGGRRNRSSPPGAGAAELTRRVAGVLGVMVPADERARLAGEVLLPRLSRLATATGGDLPGVPPWADGWVEARARVMRERLAAADYGVLGDPGLLAVRAGAGPPTDEQALAVAVAALLGGDGTTDRPARARGEERR